MLKKLLVLNAGGFFPPLFASLMIEHQEANRKRAQKDI